MILCCFDMEDCMKLIDYLATHSLSQEQFASMVGATQGFVSHVITGRSLPGGRKVLLWSKATNWLVTPHDLNPDLYPNPEDAIPPRKEQSA